MGIDYGKYNDMLQKRGWVSLGYLGKISDGYTWVKRPSSDKRVWIKVTANVDKLDFAVELKKKVTAEAATELCNLAKEFSDLWDDIYDKLKAG